MVGLYMFGEWRRQRQTYQALQVKQNTLQGVPNQLRGSNFKGIPTPLVPKNLYNMSQKSWSILYSKLYYLKWVKTFWTYSTPCTNEELTCCSWQNKSGFQSRRPASRRSGTRHPPRPWFPLFYPTVYSAVDYLAILCVQEVVTHFIY